jgi:hypothetical protein
MIAKLRILSPAGERQLSHNPASGMTIMMRAPPTIGG